MYGLAIFFIFPSVILALTAPLMALTLLCFSVFRNCRSGAFYILLWSFIRSIYWTVAFCALAVIGAEAMLDKLVILTVFCASFTLCSAWLWLTVGLKQPEQDQN
jgi:hypothetical protein